MHTLLISYISTLKISISYLKIDIYNNIFTSTQVATPKVSNHVCRYLETDETNKC